MPPDRSARRLALPPTALAGSLSGPRTRADRSADHPAGRVAIAVTVSALLVLTGCSKPAPQVQEDVRPVRSIVVSAGPSQRDTSYPAEIRPRVESRLGFRVAGKIVERLVDAGATVKPGQPLARLDARDLSLSEAAANAQVAQAQANYELAQVAVKRTQALAAQNFVSGSQVDQAATQLRAAKAQMDAAAAQARAQGNQAGYATLVADRAGVVMAIEAEAGQVVAVGAPVVRLAVGQDKDVVFNLPEQAARALTPGKTIKVTLWSAPGQVLSATVRDVAPVADPVTRTYLIKAALADPGNVASLGLTANAHLVADNVASTGIVVPLTAVVSGAANDGNANVWVVENGVVRRKPVKIAGPVGSGLLIAEGLTAGQVVVTAGVHTIQEGQKVKLLEADPAKPVATAPTALTGGN